MTEKQSPPIVWRYVGPGYFPGIPPRDLTQSDVDALTITDLLNLEAGAAYQQVKLKADDKPAAKAEDKKGGA